MQETDKMKLWRGVKIGKRQKQIQHSEFIGGLPLFSTGTLGRFVIVNNDELNLHKLEGRI